MRFDWGDWDYRDECLKKINSKQVVVSEQKPIVSSTVSSLRNNFDGFELLGKSQQSDLIKRHFAFDYTPITQRPNSIQRNGRIFDIFETGGGAENRFFHAVGDQLAMRKLCPLLLKDHNVLRMRTRNYLKNYRLHLDIKNHLLHEITVTLSKTERKDIFKSEELLTVNYLTDSHIEAYISYLFTTTAWVEVSLMVSLLNSLEEIEGKLALVIFFQDERISFMTIGEGEKIFLYFTGSHFQSLRDPVVNGKDEMRSKF
jgi:hypothetical protein